MFGFLTAIVALVGVIIGGVLRLVTSCFGMVVAGALILAIFAAVLLHLV